MPDFYISKIKFRRGTNAQRTAVRLDQGEPAFTTDNSRLYIGNGVANGGISVTTKNHTPLTTIRSLTATYSEVGDIASVDNIWYQLTANPYTDITKWGRIATKISQEFEYDSSSTINVKLSGLSASKINPNTVSNGLRILNGQLEVNYNPMFFELSANKLSLSANSITQREIKSTSFGNGLSGGNGDTITLRVRPENFTFLNGALSANYDSLSSTTFFTPQASIGNLSLLPFKNRDVSTVDGVLYQNIAGAWTDIGDRKSLQRSVFTTLTCLSAFTGSGASINNSLSSIFNGRPSHAIAGVGGIPGLTITQFRTLSSNGSSTVVVNLSSAGFLTFEGDSTSKSGQPFGRFAIPIFAY